MPFKLCFLFEVSLHIQPSIYLYLHIFIHSFVYHSSVTNTVLKHEWPKETWERKWLFVIYVQIIIHHWGKSRQELKQSRDMEAENGACRSHEGVLLPCSFCLLSLPFSFSHVLHPYCSFPAFLSSQSLPHTSNLSQIHSSSVSLPKRTGL